MPDVSQLPGYAGWTAQEIRDTVADLWRRRAIPEARVWIRRGIRALRKLKKEC